MGKRGPKIKYKDKIHRQWREARRRYYLKKKKEKKR